MPRVYRRKTPKIDPAVLQAAVNAYRNNDTTQETVAAEYGIPRSTLSYYAKAGRIIPEKIGQGRGTIFTAAEENEIEKFVIDLCLRCYPLSRSAFAKFVFHMAKQTGREGRFSKHEDRQFAGRQFIHDFLRRHPRLSFRTGTCISLYRVQGFNEMAVQFFFDNLEACVREHGFGPHQIFNVDESGFTIVPETRVKYLGEKGAQRIPVIRRQERGQLVTMVGCFSAAGFFVPPYFVFNKNLKQIERKIGDGPAGCSFAKSKSGWISTDVFVLWLQFFISHLPADETILLILDNHTAHLSWEGLMLCKQKGIVVLTLPPHCSHEMQPCDVGFFSPLKYRYSTSVDEWQRKNPFKFPLPEDIPGLLKGAWEKTARVDVGVNAFKHTGIWDPVLNRPKREVYDQVFQDGTRNRRAPIRFQVELEGGAIVDVEQAHLTQARGGDEETVADANHYTAEEAGTPILLSHVSDVDIEMNMEMDEEEYAGRDDLLTVDAHDLTEMLAVPDDATVTIDTSAFKELMQTYNGMPPIPMPLKSTRTKNSEVATSDQNMAILEEKKKKKDKKVSRKKPAAVEPPVKRRRGRPPKAKDVEPVASQSRVEAVTQVPKNSHQKVASSRAQYKRKAKNRSEAAVLCENNEQMPVAPLELDDEVVDINRPTCTGTQPRRDVQVRLNTQMPTREPSIPEPTGSCMGNRNIQTNIGTLSNAQVQSPEHNNSESIGEQQVEKSIHVTIPIAGPSRNWNGNNSIYPILPTFTSGSSRSIASERTTLKKDTARGRIEATDNTVALSPISIPGPSQNWNFNDNIYPNLPTFTNPPSKAALTSADSERGRAGEEGASNHAIANAGSSWNKQGKKIMHSSGPTFKIQGSQSQLVCYGFSSGDEISDSD